MIAGHLGGLEKRKNRCWRRGEHAWRFNMVIIDLTARSTTMTSGRWNVGVRTDRVFFASTRRITMNPFDTRAPRRTFRWVPSGAMAQWSLPSQAGRAPSKLLARESHALQRLTQARFRGSSEASEKIVHQLQHRRQVSQKFISATPLGPICQACGSSRTRLRPREPKTSLAKFKQWH